jgi:ABC-2 type transport system permease protein
MLIVILSDPNMNKYLKIIRLFWLSAIASEMEYRLNFVLSSLSSLGNLVGSLFGLYLFYRQDYRFDGWSWPAATIVLGIFTCFQGYSTTFLSPNLNKIVDRIQQGTLDFVLLKPISSQLWVSTNTISPWGVSDLVFGVLLILYGGNQLNLNWVNYLWGIIPISSGAVILYSLWFMLGATSIWFVKIYNVTEVLRGLLEAGRYPIVAYPIAYRFFFTFIVPVTFLTTVPAEAILGKMPTQSIGIGVILALVLFILAHLFWKFALRFYTSASS